MRPVTLALSWAGGEAGFDGRAGLSPLGIEGRLALDATDLGPLMAMAGQAAPELPQGLGRERLAMEGEFTLASEGTAHLRGARFTFDDNALTGDIDVMPGAARPRIRAVLTGGVLDLSGLTGDGDSGGGTGTGGGWSREPIDVSALHGVDADAALVLAGLDLGIVQLGAVDLRATLDAGRLVFDLREVAAYDGNITGQYVVNGRGGLSMGADLAIDGVRLSPLLSDVAGYERLEGTGNAELDVLLVGNDMHSLMNSAEGVGAGPVRAGGDPWPRYLGDDPQPRHLLPGRGTAHGLRQHQRELRHRGRRACQRRSAVVGAVRGVDRARARSGSGRRFSITRWCRG